MRGAGRVWGGSLCPSAPLGARPPHHPSPVSCGALTPHANHCPGSCSDRPAHVLSQEGGRGQVKGHPLCGHRLAPSASPGSPSPCRLLAPPRTLRSEGAAAPQRWTAGEALPRAATARTGVFLIQAVTARDATTTQAEFKTPESKFQTFVSPHVQNSHQKCLLSTRKPKGTG